MDEKGNDSKVPRTNVDRELTSSKSAEIDDPLSTWREKLDTTNLSIEDFDDLWHLWSSNLFKIEPINPGLSASSSENKVIDCLENIMCNGTTKEVLDSLGVLNNPSNMCRKVLEIGELVHTCKECRVDSVTILCNDCFQESAHKDHAHESWKTSGKSSVCDCGDTEAWHKDPCCGNHLAEVKSDDTPLPEDIGKRLTVTFQAVLKYCFDLLSMEQSVNNFGFSNGSNYCLVFFLDDRFYGFAEIVLTFARVFKSRPLKNYLYYINCFDAGQRGLAICESYERCTELKAEIDKITTEDGENAIPLKMIVENSEVVSRQVLALKLLSWLRQYIIHCEEFHAIFSKIALDSIVQKIMIKDHSLWPPAKKSWHKLVISLLTENYQNKSAVAIIFIGNYRSMVRDFVIFGNDYSDSMLRFSPQLFTTPSLSYCLIAQHDALLILLNTFISENSIRCDQTSKISISKASLARTKFIIIDLKYLLGSKPKIWNNDLRQSFIRGLSLFLELLDYVQSNEEPEYDIVVMHNLLVPPTNLFLEWCTTDKDVFEEVFLKLLKVLKNSSSRNAVNEIFQEVAEHSSYCIDRVADKSATFVYLPLSRALASLFLNFETFNLSLDEYSNILSKKFIVEVIESALRVQAMISQSKVRIQCDKLNTQVDFYEVACGHEMMDKDVLLLQIGGTLLDSNEFIIHLLNKFNLVDWAKEEYENFIEGDIQTIQTTVRLVEEFLGLLIKIIKERYVPGVAEVTEDECLRYKVIQRLSIKPMSLSDLKLMLPNNIKNATKVEALLRQVAVESIENVFKLKSDFIHSENDSCLKFNSQTMPKLSKNFKFLVNLLQCDVMIHLMKTVLTRKLDRKVQSFSDTQMRKILYLIGYALQEQESSNYDFFSFTDKAVKYDIYNLLKKIEKTSMHNTNRELLISLLEKYKVVANLCTKLR